MLSIRPDLKIEQLRGNLDTRLRKLDEGQFDAIILAAAGVKRLGWAERITEVIEPGISLPAIGQGAIGIECRVDDEFTNKLIAPLNNPETSVCVRAERACLKKLEGGCQVPIAAHARLISHKPSAVSSQEDAERQTLNAERLVMDGLVGSVSGDRIIKSHIEGNPKDAESLGLKLAEDLLLKGAKEILLKGVDMIDISGGYSGSRPKELKEIEGYYVQYSEALKEIINVPINVTGGIRTPEFANYIIKSGKADTVGIGRALLADKEWISRAKRILEG